MVYPVFIEIIVKVIAESKAIVMIIAANKPEYSLSSFEIDHHSPCVSPHDYSRYHISCLFLVTFPTLDINNPVLIRLKYEEQVH